VRQIIALGGGGFSMEPENPLLDQYILKQSNKEKPEICFIPTASGDSDTYISRFYHAFMAHNCVSSHLSLFKPPTRDLESYLLSKDIIFVGGGNTKNLLALWKEWNLDSIMKKAWQQGIVLSGISAGALCWFQEGVTDSYGDGLEAIECLGFLKGSHCPHYDGEELRRPSYQKYIQTKTIQSGIAADDGVALHYINEELKNIVSSRSTAHAYRVEESRGEIVEVKLETNYLG
jgi:dipeptidase E